MKGKGNKQKEDEALKLLEEQKKKEEEDRLLREEMKKFSITILPTGLPLTMTEYYMSEAMIATDCQAFTHQYLCKVLRNAGCFEQFRPIDMQILVDELVYNLVFAKIEMGWQDLKAQVFLNMFYEIYRYQNNKFVVINSNPPSARSNFQEEEKYKCPHSQYVRTSSRQQQQRKRSTANPNKSKEGDWLHFKSLLVQHSNDGPNSQKVFNSNDLVSILDYARKTYFAHHSLILLANRIDQRPLEIVLNLQIEKPPVMPPLSAAISYTTFQKKPSKESHQGEVVEAQGEQQLEQVPPRELTDEELLEPEVLALLEARLQATKEQLERKLATRQAELEEKVQEQASVKK